MRTPILFVAALTVCAAAAASAQPNVPPARPVLAIPRMTAPPVFEDFLDMQPSEDTVRTMRRVTDFIQRWPADGEPERFKTVAYVGYTDDALHVVYLAFDPDPAALRAHLIRREDVFVVNDDEVELRLDTFGDGTQSYYFVSNPLGVQLDAAWPEVGGQYDESFDLVWHTRGQRTREGFVVLMTIPFRSLRFKPSDDHAWGIYLGRWIPRTGEWTFWPRISNRQQSFLAQMARVEGVRDVSRGRGVQLIPYAASRAFRAIDARDPAGPRVNRDNTDPRAGIDAKFVVRDSLVLDLTANPDFSQVESDAPQITSNQRFEVFFPEKRPFFLENGGFLQTPINLFFTRRLEDPNLGARLTGRLGPWTVGALAADDGAPGQRVAADHPLSGARAWAGVGRVSRTLFGQSSVGGLITHRRLAGRDNTVAGADTRLRFKRVWTADAQLALSRADAAATARNGSAYVAALGRNGRTLTTRTVFEGRSDEFATELGYIPRVDFHQASQSITITSRPAKTLNDWGPTLLVERTWAFDGTPLDWHARPSAVFNFKRSTSFGAFADAAGVGLRPGDVANVASLTHLRTYEWGFHASTSPRPAWSFSANVTLGDGISYQPAGTRAPETGDQLGLRMSLGWRPLTPLRITNTWLRNRLTLRDDRRAFVTDIIRTQWAWQFTREWSLRLIGQYEGTAADAALTRVAPRRNLNADVLLTRLINPWTAVYVGYNRNAQNLTLEELSDGRRRLRRTNELATDAWQVFVKWSHLLRW